jgi:putative transposase
MAAVDEHRGVVGVKPLCDALAVSRETYYRRTRPRHAGPRRRRPRPTRALSDEERGTVLELLFSERFADRSPAEVYGTLLDEGIYRCSLRTMYRVLKANQAVRERRDQLRHPDYKKPELLATAPNQVWSWDISVPQQAA